MASKDITDTVESLHKSYSGILKSSLDVTSRLSVLKQKEAVKLSFEDINYSVDVPCTDEEIALNGMKTKSIKILKGVTGFAKPGKATFIMGGSGAGKTSLFNIISYKVKPGKDVKLTGKVMLNDVNASAKLFNNYSAYVMQDDILF
eukprot:CAMPEP_0116880044 /NCGR_PEP_ID=MMETSP0463-20121206/11898_1 /TAXON_ID=181622 /ORGANISM="Strombidinopsis sp, Strain SopsisLIS2011" /LENGTH=145 /DNA_ID=CAMNT_0004530079 /DNA_START=42 /DNA_END=479 /DNA_ORIENTATION=+